MGNALQTTKKVLPDETMSKDMAPNKPNNLLKGDGFKELDPIKLFGLWFGESFRWFVEEPYYMTLCTVGLSGQPSARTVSLGGFDENGFYFSTTETANKVKQLKDNPHACANFYWHKVGRTVRIEGKVHEVDKLPNDDFEKLPKEVKINITASPNTSEPVNEGEWEPFLANYQKLREQYEIDSDHIPRPGFLKSYIIAPNMIEFMQINDDQPNDRIQFTKSDDNSESDNLWTIRRLYP